jgi:hypothetical protein
VARINSRVANLALILFGIASALLIAEAGIRISGLGETNFYIFDRDLGWKLKPGAAGWQTDEGRAFVTVNEQGFRGPRVPVEKPPGTFRIAVLGDSFTEAQQVPYEETFPAVIERDLANCPALNPAGAVPRKIEVLDLGCDGYGTAQELLAMRDQAARFSPDLVVLAFFTGNDVRNNSPILEGDKCRPFFVHRGDELMLGGPFEESFWFRNNCRMRFWSRHSQVLDAIGKARSAIRQRLRKKRPNPKPSVAQGEPGINDLTFAPPRDEVWNEAWRLTEDEIAALNREVTRTGAQLLVVTLSSSIQVAPNPAMRDRYAHRLGVSDLFYPDLRIKQAADRQGIAALNLAPSLQQYAEQHQVCVHGFENASKCGGHWNQLGHQLGGDLIANRICDLIRSGAIPVNH